MANLRQQLLQCEPTVRHGVALGVRQHALLEHVDAARRDRHGRDVRGLRRAAPDLALRPLKVRGLLLGLGGRRLGLHHREQAGACVCVCVRAGEVDSCLAANHSKPKSFRPGLVVEPREQAATVAGYHQHQDKLHQHQIILPAPVAPRP
ncbi:hypothetical protein PybrP1_006893 [[Pythium] brassicae (nom. inval.)]|nr:hypothetical protein PybrP1_006893 [[Pythium] brassicae (nom. inval.)]